MLMLVFKVTNEHQRKWNAMITSINQCVWFASTISICNLFLISVYQSY